MLIRKTRDIKVKWIKKNKEWKYPENVYIPLNVLKHFWTFGDFKRVSQCPQTLWDITLLTKVHLVKAMVFPVVMHGCESWTIKKAECWRIELSNYGAREDSWESLGLQGDQISQS